MPSFRKAAVASIKILWSTIRKLTNTKNRGSISQEELVSYLISCGRFVDKHAVSTIINDAVYDGLIVMSDDGLLQLPSVNINQNYDETTPDWYCYECHTVGEVQKCQNCPRVFHVACNLSDAEKEAFWDQLDYHRVNGTTGTTLMKYKEPDPQNTHNDVDAHRRVCYGCRLIRKALIRKRHVMSKEELNYLLTFAYDRVASWMPDSTENEDYIIELSESNLLRFPMKIDTLKEKLQNQEYTMIEEFLRDILDLTHNNAIVYGKQSEEFEATNYLYADALFEIGEIKTCRDCYRHSNEKFDESWFTIPCATRKHELVYAKAPGFPYWPAKVVKINEDGKYDVRFFGGDHSRSIISSRNIEPIEKSLKRLNNGRKIQGPLQMAMREFEEHQNRLRDPIDLYTFEAEKTIRDKNKSKSVPKQSTIAPPKKVVNSNQSIDQSSSTQTNPVSLKKKSFPNVNHTSKVQTKERPSPLKKETPLVEEPQNSASPIVSRRNTLINLRDAPAPKRVKLERQKQSMEEAQGFQTPTKTESPSTNSGSPITPFKNETLAKLETRLQNAQSVEEAQQVAMVIRDKQLGRYLKKINSLKKKQKEDILEAKRRHWCRNCYEPARMYCCLNCSYCSKPCQVKHWDQHKRSCIRASSPNKNNNNFSSSSQ